MDYTIIGHANVYYKFIKWTGSFEQSAGKYCYVQIIRVIVRLYYLC